MRIVASHFKDYYDSCMYYGMDKTLTYVRSEAEAPESLNVEYFDETAHKSYTNGYESAQGVAVEYAFGSIGFCGTFYPFIKFMVIQPQPLPPTVVFCYNEEQYKGFMTMYPQATVKKQVSRRSWYYYGSPIMTDGRFSRYGCKSIGEYFQKFTVKNDEPFLKHKAPVLFPFSGYAGNGKSFLKVRTNVCLKDYEFFKMFDAFKTFQEISMYLGGVMPNQGKEMVQISDEDLRDKHGFDKMSFKTYSPGKKAKRRK